MRVAENYLSFSAETLHLIKDTLPHTCLLSSAPGNRTPPFFHNEFDYSRYLTEIESSLFVLLHPA